jgi:hypothetical protein
MAKDVSALKAVSQNLMHNNLTITDGVYGVLSEIDVRRQIAELGSAATRYNTDDVEELVALTRELLGRMGGNAKLRRVRLLKGLTQTEDSV